MTSTSFIKIKNVQTFLTKVSEKINTKYIKDFIYTKIQSQNLTLDDNSKIHYFYIEEISSYQITIINSKSKNIVLEPYLFLTKYLNKNDDSTNLYICNNFFALYNNGKLIYFDNIKDGTEKKDIIKYLNQTFSLSINNIYDINEEELKEYEKEYILNSKEFPQFSYMTKKSNKIAIYYLFYLFIVLMILAIYFVNYFNQNRVNIKNDMKDVKLEQVKNEYQNLLEKYEDNKKMTSYLINLLNTLNKNNIKLRSLKISQEKIQIRIKAKKKEVLLNFLDFYDEDSIINNMRYIKEDNCYEILATIRLYK